MSSCPTAPCPPVEPCEGIVCCPPNPFRYSIPLHAYYNTAQCVACTDNGCVVSGPLPPLTPGGEPRFGPCIVTIPAGTYFSDESQDHANQQAIDAAQAIVDQCCAPVVYQSNPVCITCPSVDNGPDPFLGPPYPPIGFMAEGNINAGPTPPAGTAHLKWTLPAVFMSPDYASYGHFGSFIYLTGYSWPDWDGGTSYEPNMRVTRLGIRYYALNTIPNMGQPPETPSSQYWAVDDTVFKLYFANPPIQYPIPGTGVSFSGGPGTTGFLGDSISGGSGGVFPGEHWTLTFTYQAPGSSPYFFFLFTDPIGPFLPNTFYIWYGYVTATSGSTTVYSPVHAVAIQMSDP